MRKKSTIFVIALVLGIFIGYFITYRQAEAPISDGTEIVKVFFSNNILDPEVSCTKVFSVDRKVETADLAKAALEALLQGPTAGEENEGFITNINSGVILNILVIKDGIARADFSERLNESIGGSCRVSAIRAEIEETLKQFSGINEVIISVNGRTEDILQP